MIIANCRLRIGKEVVDLLWDGAREGLSIKAGYKTKYNKEQYLKLWYSLCQEAKKSSE